MGHKLSLNATSRRPGELTAISKQEEQRGLCPGGQKLTFINIIMKGGLTSKLKAENGWNEFKGTLNCKEEERKVLSVFLLLRAVFC